MRISNWSTDVCSSDLPFLPEKDAAPAFQLDRDRNRKHQWRQHHHYRHSNGQIERPLHKALMQAERASRYLETAPALEPAHLSHADFLSFGCNSFAMHSTAFTFPLPLLPPARLTNHTTPSPSLTQP